VVGEGGGGLRRRPTRAAAPPRCNGGSAPACTDDEATLAAEIHDSSGDSSETEMEERGTEQKDSARGSK